MLPPSPTPSARYVRTRWVFHISDCLFKTLFPPAKAIQAGLGVLLDVCTVLKSISRYRHDIQRNQTASSAVSNYDVLADLLRSIEHFVDRLEIYTRILPTPAMDRILVNLVVGLISTLALVTQKLKQRRLRELFLVDVLPYSA
jgi:hypothetical protein